MLRARKKNIVRAIVMRTLRPRPIPPQFNLALLAVFLALLTTILFRSDRVVFLLALIMIAATRLLYLDRQIVSLDALYLALTALPFNLDLQLYHEHQTVFLSLLLTRAVTTIRQPSRDPRAVFLLRKPDLRFSLDHQIEVVPSLSINLTNFC